MPTSPDIRPSIIRQLDSWVKQWQPVTSSPDNTHAFTNVSAVQGPASTCIGAGGKDPRKPPHGERPDAAIANALATHDRHKKRGKKIPQYQPRAPKISTTITGERRHDPCVGCKSKPKGQETRGEEQAEQRPARANSVPAQDQGQEEGRSGP